MHSHSIKELWDLPQLKIVATEKNDGQIFIESTPMDYLQPCPICASNQTIRLSCKECMASFVQKSTGLGSL